MLKAKTSTAKAQGPITTKGKSNQPQARVNAQGELLLYGAIGDWFDGNDAATIAQEISALNAGGPITLRIQSEGGAVLEGFAIIDALKATGRTVNAVIDGYALSMAAYIALSADHLAISENGWLMLHKSRMDGWDLTSADMQSQAEFLAKLDERLVQIITEKTGQDTETVSTAIEKDLWIGGAEAVAQGYADQLLQPLQQLQAAAHISLKNYPTMPKALQALVASQPHGGAPANNPKGAINMDLEKRAKAVGLKRRNNETDAQFLERITATEAKAAEAAAAKAKGAEPAPVAQAPIGPDPVPAAQAAIAQERERISALRKICATHRIEGEQLTAMIDKGTTVAQARGQVLAILAERTQSTMPRGHVTVANQGAETRKAMVQAILHRQNPTAQLDESARRFANRNLPQMAEAMLRVGGIDTSAMSTAQIAAKALSTSDFPAVVADVANKTARQAYEEYPRTFVPFATRESVSDFKYVNRVQLSGAPSLEKLDEGAEVRYGAFRESNAAYRLETYAKAVNITRQTIINDDLRAFTRVPAMFARAGARLENEVVWGLITENPNIEGDALFSAAHSNLKSSGSKISIKSLGELRAFIRLQKGLNGEHIALNPRFLIVPPELETIAQQFIAQTNAVQADQVNPFAGTLQLIVEPLLSDTSAVSWYMAADAGAIDTIEYAYLNGQDGVQIDTWQNHDVEGITIKARLDFGAGLIDYRGLAKNNGN